MEFSSTMDIHEERQILNLGEGWVRSGLDKNDLGLKHQKPLSINSWSFAIDADRWMVLTNTLEIPHLHPEHNNGADPWKFCQNLFHLRKDHGEFGLGINQSSSRDVQLWDSASQTFGVLLWYDERAA